MARGKAAEGEKGVYRDHEDEGGGAASGREEGRQGEEILGLAQGGRGRGGTGRVGGRRDHDERMRGEWLINMHGCYDTQNQIILRRRPK